MNKLISFIFNVKKLWVFQYVSMYTLCMPGLLSPGKGVRVPGTVESCHVGDRNWTQVFLGEQQVLLIAEPSPQPLQQNFKRTFNPCMFVCICVSAWVYTCIQLTSVPMWRRGRGQWVRQRESQSYRVAGSQLVLWCWGLNNSPCNCTIGTLNPEPFPQPLITMHINWNSE